ncbi:Hypothetical protein FKW44_003253, partial [Caligus rogercresseyi]
SCCLLSVLTEEPYLGISKEVRNGRLLGIQLSRWLHDPWMSLNPCLTVLLAMEDCTCLPRENCLD